MTRTLRLEQLSAIKELTPKQIEWVKDNYKKYNNLIDLFKGCAVLKKQGGGSPTVKGSEKLLSLIRTLENPPFSMEDTVDKIVDWEKELLGIPISCSRVDKKNLQDVNCTCKEFIEGKKFTEYNIAGEIKNCRIIKIKNGKSAGSDMAFLTIDDGTCIMGDVTCFANTYTEFSYLLKEDAVLLFSGIRDNKKGQNFIVNRVYEL